MGVLYGIDVGNGAGVRGTATNYDANSWDAPQNPTGGNTPQPTLDRLDAFASIVNAYAPFNVKELCDKQQVVLVAADPDPYGQHFADVFDVGMLTVAELCGDWGSHPLSFTATDVVMVASDFEVSLSVDPPVVREDRLSPAHYAGFEVDDYIAISGKAIKVHDLIVDVKVTTGVGNVKEIQTFPLPQDVNLLAKARWLPVDWSIDPWVTYWVPYSGFDPGPRQALSVQEFKDEVSECRNAIQYEVKDFLQNGNFHIRPVTDISFDSSPGVNPTFLPKYTYYRDGGYVRNASISMRKGRHMWSDEINWNAQEVTLVMVCVLHEPTKDWFGVMETEAPNTQGLDPFFGIRYHRQGVLNLWADSVLASAPINTGMGRPAQPIVVGMNIDMVNNTCSLLSVDQNVKVQTTSLPQRYDNRSRLWLGRSPFGADATSAIDILEVGYWEQPFGPGDLYSLLSEYDRIYGVTSS